MSADANLRSQNGVTTVGDTLRRGAERLARAGIAEPRREARLLLALAMGVDPGIVLGYPERLLDGAAQERVMRLVERRAAHEPFSRIAGRRQFWSFDLALSAETLDPRPDSETLVEAALALRADRDAALRILDLGVGSGALLLALLWELPRAIGLGVDLLPGAAATARRNAASLGLGDRALFLAGSWGQAISSGWADVILANPPYIRSSEIDGLAPEVARFEPRLALDGGPDGLRAYQDLMKELPRLLAPDGIVVLEVGAGQVDPVTDLLVKAGLVSRGVRRDLAGIKRCVVAAPAQRAD